MVGANVVISDEAFDVLRTTSLFAGFTEEQLEVVPKVEIGRASCRERV